MVAWLCWAGIQAAVKHGHQLQMASGGLQNTDETAMGCSLGLGKMHVQDVIVVRLVRAIIL